MAYLLRLLRLRYLIFGTAVGGGYAARKVDIPIIVIGGANQSNIFFFIEI